MKLSKIWYVDASQQQKNAPKKLFLDFGLFWPFSTRKQLKIDQKWRKLAKSKPFDEIFWNFVCRCFLTKENAKKNLFLDFGFFLPFFNQKTAKIYQKWRKLAKFKPFDEIFWNLVCRYFPTQENSTILFVWFSIFGHFCWPNTAKIDKKNIKKIVKSIILPLKLFSFIF